MPTNPFLAERERIASSIESLPVALKDTNAAALLKIVTQLKQSYIALLELQASVVKLDVSDSKAVSALVRHLRDYADVSTGELNEDRTRCRNIRRTAEVMDLAGAEAQGLRNDIQRLGSADDAFVQEVESAAIDALNTVESIDRADKIVDAASEHERYVSRIDGDKEEIKRNLVAMTRVANDLLDRI